MGLFSDAYNGLDVLAGGHLPGGATKEEAGTVRELAIREAARRFTPYDPQGPSVDFLVGLSRIQSGTVGAPNSLVYTPTGAPAWQPIRTTSTGEVVPNRNPTRKEAYTYTDRAFDGWLPGGAANPIHRAWDEHKDDLKDTLGVGVIAVAAFAALALGARRR